MEKVQWRERIVSDFRDFEFSWSGFFRWTGIVIAAFLVAAVIILYFLDWNQMRGPIGRYLSHRYNREVRIDGDLHVNLFTWQPRVDVGGLYIGNPAWVGTKQAANIRQARVEVRLVPLIFGHLIVPIVALDQPQVMVLRDAQGRSNWDSGSNEPTKLPPIHRFLVQNGHLDVTDAVRKLHFTGAISSEEVQGAKDRAAFTLTGDGTLNGNKFLADVKGGPLINVDESRPYHFTADVHSGATHVTVDGQITHPFHLDQFNASATFSGPNLSELFYLTGLALPQTPAYRISGALTRDEHLWRFENMRGVLGSSDLNGDLQVDAGGKLPMLTGRLTSRSLAFEDLGSVVGGGKTQSPASPYLLPDTVLHTERLRQMNAEVDYAANAIRSRDFPLTGLVTHISVEGGVLNLKPLAFSFTQGKLAGSLRIDARGAEPVTGIDARITDVHAESFIKGSDKPLTGMLEARAVLTGTGASVHRVASTAGGTFTAVVPQGGMRASLANWLGVNVISALGLTLSGDTSNTQLRCAVAHYGVKDGLMRSQQFVIDTEPVRVDGSGTINLKDETLDMSLQGKPKHFQLVRLRAPITVTGKLAKPDIGIKTGPLITQGAIGAALGIVNPLAAVLAFIDPGLAHDANCGGLLTTAQKQGAPVKKAAVQKAVAADKKK